MSHYIIVVHGIGEQRANETVLAVVNRCAEARSVDEEGQVRWPPGDVLSLGMASGQPGPWLEFENVPERWPPASRGPFLGVPPIGGGVGANLRFVDVHWADLLKEDFKAVGEAPERWAANLLGRLERKSRHAASAGGRPPRWALETLRLLRDTVVLVRRIMALRGWKSYDDLVFNRFLGDAQLYGEYAKTRGRAVRLFHRLISDIEEEDPQARYTIIAHSLGTVMSLDALLYAHAPLELRAEAVDSSVANLPFPGFLDPDGKCDVRGPLQNLRVRRDQQPAGASPSPPPGAGRGLRIAHELAGGDPGPALDRGDADCLAFLDTSWVDRVDSFVTLGSPIDKFLVIWWLNYRYLLDGSWATPRARKIRHLNYCDEQDPVGHKLDVAAGAPVFEQVFDTEEDQVFNRYAIPGAAHVQYWKDLPLFRWILSRTVDGCSRTGYLPVAAGAGAASKPVAKPDWFDERIYSKVLAYTYKLIPWSVIALDFAAFTWAWYSTSWHGRALATVLFVLVSLVGRHLVDLTVWWRQVMIVKDRRLKPQGPPTTAADVLAACQAVVGRGGKARDHRAAGVAEPVAATNEAAPDDNGRLAARKRLGKAFRGRLFWSQSFALAMAAWTSGLYLVAWGSGWPWGKTAFMALITAVTLIVWRRMFASPNVAWEGESSAAANGSYGRIALKVLLLPASAIAAGYALFAWVRSLLPVDFYPAWVTRIMGLRGMEAKGPSIAFSIAAAFVIASVVLLYLGQRFAQVKQALAGDDGAGLDFMVYAADSLDEPLREAEVIAAEGEPVGGGA